jgi:transposase-like protein
MVVWITGKRTYLWRAVDHEGEILDMLVQRRRDTRGALRPMRKLLKKEGFVPKLLVTDKLRSYASAFRRLSLGRENHGHAVVQPGTQFVRFRGDTGETAHALAVEPAWQNDQKQNWARFEGFINGKSFRLGSEAHLGV